MRELGISKSDLAQRLNAKRPFVTRLLSGQNNFTVETMVRISRALDCNFRPHMERKECETQWVNVLRSSIPNDVASLKQPSFGNFKEIRCTKAIKPSPDHAPVPAFA